MSTVTMELPDEVAAALATPEGMERAREAVLKAFPELALDTRAPGEKALDDYRAGVKARYRAKQEKRVEDAREAIRLRQQEAA